MDEVFRRVRETAEKYRVPMSRFLRDLVAIESQSCHEGKVIRRIKREMEDAGFDRVVVDPMGNVLGYVGTGQRLIAMDAHIDTVGIGHPADWHFDPYAGYEDDQTIGGLGASDQKGGLAALVFGVRIMKELGLTDGCTVVVTGTVQEEDCDGLCWQYILNEDGVRPEFVVISEPTDGRVCRGQRGRMEIQVTTRGLTCHGSAPERGDNAIYKMAPIVLELRALHENLPGHPFLGKGSLAVSEIFSTSPSRCAVAGSCWISIDRRLTAGEDGPSALKQIENLPAVRAAGAEVAMYSYAKPSYTGLVYPTESYFPAWVIEEDHTVCRTVVDSYRQLFQKEPVVDRWTFSTNAVSIMGRFGIPCIGFGPGHEDQAHSPDEKTWKQELVDAASMYAVIPQVYLHGYAGPGPVSQ